MIPVFSNCLFGYDLLLSNFGWPVVGLVLLLAGTRLLAWCTTHSMCKSESRMDGKVVIVTGCDSGIGKETARDLVKRGAKLIMASLEVERAKIVKEEFVSSTGNHNIVVRKLDLSSLRSVREFAEQMNREETRLDVLIHNAGTASWFSKKSTDDGLEAIMATNHYGPFLLTHLLIDLLKRSAPSRIIVVASHGYILSFSNLVDNPNPTSTYTGFLYFVSKYANIIFTLELARRLQGSGVTANCLHPGRVDTELVVKFFSTPGSWILKSVFKGLINTPEQGAQTSIHLAVSGEVAEVSGKYFMACQEHALMPGVKDEVQGRKFWELSERLVKLEPTDPKI